MSGVAERVVCGSADAPIERAASFWHGHLVRGEHL
jgi:hypothetical protein